MGLFKYFEEVLEELPTIDVTQQKTFLNHSIQFYSCCKSKSVKSTSYIPVIEHPAHSKA